MGWQHKYACEVEDYLKLTDQYELRLEYIDGDIHTRDGATVLLFGELTTERTYDETDDATLALIADVTEEEAPLIAEFVASLRANRR